jgi:hypothetical protein
MDGLGSYPRHNIRGRPEAERSLRGGAERRSEPRTPTREERREMRREARLKQMPSITDVILHQLRPTRSGDRVSPSAERSSFLHTQRRYARLKLLQFPRIGDLLSHRKTLGFVNLVTLCFLLSYVVGVIHGDGQYFGYGNLISSVVECDNGLCRDDAAPGATTGSLVDYLPYPANIAMQARTRRLPLPTSRERIARYAGYWEVRPGTFRSRYPSLSIDDCFDEVYAITNPKCPGQWAEFSRRVSGAGLRVMQWPMPPFKHMSLTKPPMPMLPSALVDSLTGTKAVVSIVKRQLAYLQAHRAIWEYVSSTGRQRVLIMDDNVFPNERLQRVVPSLFNQIDQESLAMQTAWHLVTFRRKLATHAATTDGKGNRTGGVGSESVWCSNPKYNHPVVRAQPSFGSSMYALSAEGARWLLEHVKVYRAPLDVEFAMLQREHAEDFVVLSACNNDDKVDFCPEIAKDISVPSSKQSEFECVWRRLQERRLAAL